MQRNANIEQMSEINKDFFVISQRVKQIFTVYCKYAKNSKKKVRFCRFYWFLCKNAVPSLFPRTNFCSSIKLCNTLYTELLQGYKWALKNILYRKIIN